MARDPPSLLASSELRDLSLEPSDVWSAQITIIHPQLRDLILPLGERRVVFPLGDTISLLEWTDREADAEGPIKLAGCTQLRPVVSLNFTPNCLTGSRGMIAAGGQHGELHISEAPGLSRLRAGAPALPSWRASAYEPAPKFRVDVKLGTSAINNAIVLLPDWPVGWAETSERRRVGYVGRQSGREHEEVDEKMEVAEAEAEGEARDEETEAGGDDEAMDLDEEDEAPQPLSPATYPNTVAFRRPSRIATTSTPPIPIPSRRAASFSHARGPPPAEPARQSRQSFSLADHPQQIRIVSSNPGPSHSRLPSERAPLPCSPPRYVRERSDPRIRAPESRLLVSSNDQSVRMLALRQLEPATISNPRPRTTAIYEQESEAARLGRFEPTIRTHNRPTTSIPALSSTDWRGLHPVLPPPPPMMGSRFGWDSAGVNQGLLDAHRSEQVAALREMRRQQIGSFETAVGLGAGVGAGGSGSAIPPIRPASQQTVRLGAQAPWSQLRATAADMRSGKRAVSAIGGKTLNCPVNHSSFSPDLRTMISVGDSTDVQIFEVIDGGREFRQIATYTAATDSAFSSAWSKDGRKFAVASQDGQVTVWDHRSSRPLATLFTSVTGSGSSSTLPSTFAHDPSFSEDISAARRSASPADGWSRDRGILLFNPITGEPSSGASTSGREAARVVKFSPEGSGRDLMVFSEENTNIHVVDAKTFNTHVVLPVPIVERGSSSPTPPTRSGVHGGECGIAGVAFDPTGDWLYSGTERTVVEWDMRRMGEGASGGGWNMA